MTSNNLEVLLRDEAGELDEEKYAALMAKVERGESNLTAAEALRIARKPKPVSQITVTIPHGPERTRPRKARSSMPGLFVFVILALLAGCLIIYGPLLVLLK